MSAGTDLAGVFCVKLERPLRVDSVERVTSPKSHTEKPVCARMRDS